VTTKLVHGIDLFAPGGLAKLFAHNRARFGDLRMEAGGDGGAGDGGAGDGGEGKEGSAGKAGEGDPPGTEPPKGADGNTFDPERAQASILAARTAENVAKAEAKETKRQLAEVLKAMGLGDDGKPDPAKLSSELSAAQKRAKATAIENLVLRRAGKAGADGDALLDSRSFLDSLAAIDPDSSAAGDDVEAAITAALKANKRLAAKASTASSSGGAGNGNGGPSGGAARKPASLAEAITSHYTP
jgi:hypothetical protein